MSMCLFYIQDPMCSWCWGFRPVWLDVKHFAESKNIPIEYLNGGLAPDSCEPMPQETREFVQENWRRIQQAIPGIEFNYDFWTQCQPRRSTYPACRAVIAAEQLQVGSAEAMIYAIQQAYYLQATNPSDEQTLIDCAVSLHLDAELFTQALHSIQTQQQFESQQQRYELLAMRTGVSGFPSLVVEYQQEYVALPRDYHSAGPIIQAIEAITHGHLKRNTI